jgi:formylmethanofuran dehydrogenase subunit E
MNAICQYTVAQYIDKLTDFHTNLAPGVLVGGFMVDAAVKRMTAYEFFDAICETTLCLPDAIQILTPCTVGNGWLRIVNTGRFALTLYDKKSGNGVRVSMDASKLDRYPEIKRWFMRLVSKREQDRDALVSEIQEAGNSILSMKTVRVSPTFLVRHASTPIALCRSCNEAYFENDSELCLACQGKDIYI